MMRVLVVYYSRTGLTRKISEAIASHLDADIEELKEAADRSGPIGYIKAGQDALLGKESILAPPLFNPDDYDLVVIGTPVWAFTMCPAIRTYINKYSRHFPKTAFFCTLSGTGKKRTLQAMEDESGCSPLATTAFIDRAIRKDKVTTRLNEFITLLNPGAPETKEEMS